MNTNNLFLLISDHLTVEACLGVHTPFHNNMIVSLYQYGYMHFLPLAQKNDDDKDDHVAYIDLGPMCRIHY